MNVYTHVDMADLESDVESLPAMGDGRTPNAQINLDTPSCGALSQADEGSRIPADLASLAKNWASLPDHIRQAIATLCSA